MGKGGTTNTQPTIPPELQPLYRGSVSNVLAQQRQAPLGGFNERYPEQVAGLNPLERYSIGQSYGLFNPQATDAMALQDIMSLPDLYAAGPTTGEYTPSNLDLRSFMDLLGGPQYGQIGQEADYPPGGPFGPEPGPAAPVDGGPSYPTPPRDGEVPRVPIIQPTPGEPGPGGIGPQSATPGAPPHTETPYGFWADTQGRPNSRGFIGSNHTYVQFGPDGYVSQILTQPGSSNDPNETAQQSIPFDPYSGGGAVSPSSATPGGPPTVSTPYTPAGTAPPPITQEQFMQSQPAGAAGYGAAPLAAGGLEQMGVQQALGIEPRMDIIPVDRDRPPPTIVPFRPPTKDDINANLSDLLKGDIKTAVPTTASQYGGPAYQQALNKVQNAGTGTLSAATPFGESPGILAGYAKVSGKAVRDDPAVAAALAEFQRLIQPGLENQYSLSGLGRSTALPAALSLGQASMLTPLMMDALAREQHRLDRGYGSTEEELGRRERSSVRRAEATSQRIGQLMGLSAQQYGQRQGAIQTGLQAGGVQRGVAQQGLSNAYTDFLRRQGLSEQALYAPFGQTGTAGVGSLVRQSK